MNTTETRLTEDAILGIDRALSAHEAAIREAIVLGADPESDSMAELLQCLRAAQSWLMATSAQTEETNDDDSDEHAV